MSTQAERSRRYRQRNKERISARRKELYTTDRRRAEHARFKTKHPDRLLEIQRAANKRHRETPKEKERRRVYARQHPEIHRFGESRRRARKRLVIGNITRAEWNAIKESQNGRCYLCGAMANLEMDHVVPISLGGCHMAHNIKGACKPCNTRKRDKLLINEISLFDRIRG